MKGLFKLPFPCLREKGRGRGLAIFLSLLITQEVMADGIVVVPAKAAGYLYNPDANDSNVEEISLHLIKEGGFTNYRIESDPPGLLCDESCPETLQRLPAGKITLNIVGNKPFPVMKIPLRGYWTEGCDDLSNETNKCVMNLNETNRQVKLSVDPNVVTGTILPLEDNQEAMFIKEDLSRGYILVAAHRYLGAGRTWLDVDFTQTKKWGIDSPVDGQANTTKLVGRGSEAASYCAELRDSEGWYLPARMELAAMTKDALDKIPGIDTSSFLWTSTENSFSVGNSRTAQAMALDNSNSSIKNNRDYWRCPADATDKSQCDNIRRYQVLCFKRVPI